MMEFIGATIVLVLVLVLCSIAFAVAFPGKDRDEIRQIVEDLASIDDDAPGRALMKSAPETVLRMLRDRARKALQNA